MAGLGAARPAFVLAAFVTVPVAYKDWQLEYSWLCHTRAGASCWPSVVACSRRAEPPIPVMRFSSLICSAESYRVVHEHAQERAGGYRDGRFDAHAGTELADGPAAEHLGTRPERLLLRVD